MKTCYFREHHHKTLLIFHWRNQANLGTPKFANYPGRVPCQGFIGFQGFRLHPEIASQISGLKSTMAIGGYWGILCQSSFFLWENHRKNRDLAPGWWLFGWAFAYGSAGVSSGGNGFIGWHGLLDSSDVKGGGFLDEFQRSIHQYFLQGKLMMIFSFWK